MMSWHIVTSAEYKLGNKVAEDLYFLSDTKEIYRGAVPFTEGVVLYNATLPTESIAKNRLYIDSASLAGYIHDGEKWTNVIKAVASEVTAEGEAPVSGKAVAAYVTAALAGLSTSTVISSLSWDAAEHILTATKGDKTQETIVFDGLGCKLNYISATGKLQLLDASGNKLGEDIDLALEKFVHSGEYDATTKSIILYFDEAKTDSVTIPVGDLIDVYVGEETTSATVEVGTGNKIKATIKISQAEGNTLIVKEDGLYVAAPDLSALMDKVPDAKEGNIATFGTNGQVVDSGKTFADLASNATIYQGASISEAVGESTPNKGDYCIVKKVISGDKTELTAYYYNGTDWVAFDGNYSAENVYFPADLLTTSAVGNITLTNGQANVAVGGKNLVDAWNTIFVKEKSPAITQPSVSISAPQNKAYEVGTSVAPSYTATLNAGKYEFGPATGITATVWEVTDTDAHTLTTNAGKFDAFTVGDETSYKITAKATYADGAVPLTNTKNEFPSGQIKAGSKSATTTIAITGFRKCFYGTLTSKTGTLDSAAIRALAKSMDAPKNGSKFSIPIPVGALRVVFAYPATLEDVASVKDVNGLGAESKSAFTVSNVDVEGANGYTAKSYKVYVCDFANANDKANTFDVQI